MRKTKRIYLAAIRRALQETYLYESRKKRNYAFEVLYHGWRQKGIRHGRNAQVFTIAWKRGWLGPTDADDFRKYIGLR